MGGVSLMPITIDLGLVNKHKLHQCVRVQIPPSANEEKIQELILKEISPNLLDKFVGKNPRADFIRKWFNRNTEKTAVIILDGLYHKIDLDAIGIPNNEEKKCDVILIARDMDLLMNDMDVSNETTFHVKQLPPVESTALFLYYIKKPGQAINEEKKSVARELVKYSGGLPKLIKQHASVLKNQRDIYAWHDALRERKSQNIEKMLEPVKKTLSSWSSDVGDTIEIRSLFSICGLFREPSISIEDLIIHHRALSISAQNMTVKETEVRVKYLLHVLRARSLLDGDNNKVIINDLFREVAELIASDQRYHVLRNGGSNMSEQRIKNQLKMSIALSIDGLNIFEDHPKLKYPELKMLQLRSSNDQFLEIKDDRFFDNMKVLEGMHLKQVGFISSSFPSTTANLENLHTLCLVSCRLKDVTNICNLKKLQILKISGSDIIELPKGVTCLTNLRSLDLRGCHKLQVIEQGILSKLKQLEELYLDDSFGIWAERPHMSRSKNASLNDLNRCTCLSTLHVYIPDSTKFPENLALEKLEKYKILLGDVRNHSEGSVSERTLRLDLSNSTSILWDEGVRRMMYKTTSLYLKGMARMPKPSIHQLCSEGYLCLRDLHLQSCDSVEYIIESSVEVLAFPNLEILTLVDMKNLRKICSGPLMDDSFGQLNEVDVEKCDALENLFDFSLMENISALRKIQIKDCKNMTEIVNNDIGHNEGKRKKIIWNKLRHLSLENLRQIVSFCITGTSSMNVRSKNLTSKSTAFFDGELISFPGLKTLSLSKLPMVKNIWHQNQLPELSNLRSLTVEGFEAPNFEDILFCPPQRESFLQKALVFCCLKAQVDHDSQTQSPQGLMTSEMEKKKDQKQIATQTGTLYPKGYLQGNSRHQNLHCLVVCGCEKLKFLFTASMVQALPCLTKLTIKECKIMEEVIRMDKDNGLKSIEFQGLTDLCLGSLENLTTFSKGNISISFPSLKSLEVSNCLRLRALFTDSKYGEATEEISCSLFHAKVSPSFPSLESLDIRSMNNLIRIWQCHVYGRAISSHDDGSGGSSSKDSTSKLWRTFLNIKTLRIADCGSLEKILDVEGSLDADMFDKESCLNAQLNEVSLSHLMNIEQIWGRNDPRGRKIRYRYLQTVSLCNCQRIEFLFPASMTKDLLRLQSIKVESCDEIKHLIGEEDSSSGNDAPKFFFPDVKILELQKLQKLMTFYRGPHCSEWPALDKLSVSECNNFEIFGSEYETSEPSNQDSLGSKPLFSVNEDSFCRLSTLELSRNQSMKQIWQGSCPEKLFQKLKVIKLVCFDKEHVVLPSKFLNGLHHLEILHLDNLHLPDHVVQNRKIVRDPPPKCLQEVKLSMIPEINDLGNALSLTASVQSLEYLTILKVSNCHNLEFLFKFFAVQKLRCLTRLTIANCERMKVIVKSARSKKEDEVSLDKLECLTLVSLPELTSFWEGNCKFKFPSLEEVTIRECPKMMTFTQGEATSPNLSKMELNGKKNDLDLSEERNLNKLISESKA